MKLCLDLLLLVRGTTEAYSWSKGITVPCQDFVNDAERTEGSRAVHDQQLGVEPRQHGQAVGEVFEPISSMTQKYAFGDSP